MSFNRTTCLGVILHGHANARRRQLWQRRCNNMLRSLLIRPPLEVLQSRRESESRCQKPLPYGLSLLPEVAIND